MILISNILFNKYIDWLVFLLCKYCIKAFSEFDNDLKRNWHMQYMLHRSISATHPDRLEKDELCVSVG